MKYSQSHAISQIDARCTLRYASIILHSLFQDIEGFELPNEQSRLLLFHAVNVCNSGSPSNEETYLTNSQKEIILNYLKQDTLIPVPYYLGYSIINDLKISVRKGVTLLPGTETKFLINEINKRLPNETPSIFLDVCTGSGIIAICVAKENEEANVYASDISNDALSVANKNIKRHKLQNRVFLVHGSWLTPYRKQMQLDGKVDLIAANPPYVESSLVNDLPSAFISVTPNLAVDGGRDGLKGFKNILKDSHKLLKRNGCLIFQTNEGQAHKVEQLVVNSGFYTNIQLVRGATGEDRIVVSQKS